MNTKKAYKQLLDSGIPEKQADVITNVIDDSFRQVDIFHYFSFTRTPNREVLQRLIGNTNQSGWKKSKKNNA